jgi:hypothetical protein
MVVEMKERRNEGMHGVVYLHDYGNKNEEDEGEIKTKPDGMFGWVFIEYIDFCQEILFDG